MNKTLRLAAAALGVLAFGLSASGLMIKAPLADLTAGAAAIVLGRVIEARSSWSLDNSLIVTLTTIEVRETLKGRSVSRLIAVQTPGGQVGDLRLAVSDEPGFAADETVLLFLKPLSSRLSGANSILALTSPEPVYTLLEKAQGKYSIDGNGLAVKTGYRLLAADGSDDTSLPLDELKKRIRALLRGPAAARRIP